MAEIFNQNERSFLIFFRNEIFSGKRDVDSFYLYIYTRNGVTAVGRVQVAHSPATRLLVSDTTHWTRESSWCAGNSMLWYCPRGNSVNSVRGTFAVVHLGELHDEELPDEAVGGVRRSLGQPTEVEEDRCWSWAR